MRPAKRNEKRSRIWPRDRRRTSCGTRLTTQSLIELKVGRGDRVGVMLTKSLETQIAIFGILKAGAVFVPIDPAAPAGRVRFILRDCSVRIIVSESDRHRALARILAEETPLEAVMGLDEARELPVRAVSWSEVASAKQGAPDVAATELDLAYIMYTSGSTGEPKGLMHTHYSGLSYARLSADTYEVTPVDRISDFAPLHVDQCTFACFTARLKGATTIVIPDEIAAFPVDLARLIEAERISIWYSVPLALIQLVDRGDLGDFNHSSLRWVTFGGEPFPPKHLRSLMSYWPQARFSNIYGPAEVNQCTHYDFGAADIAGEESVPIGEVWADSQGLIVDDEDREVADGQAGELIIRSPTMMQGYWRRPDLDAKAFYLRETLPNFRECYYRTGDLVRRRVDGMLEFIGRKDRQIKVRGYRVELDEVEAALCAHEAVREAAAFADGKSPEDRRVLAAVILHDGAIADERQILRHASGLLASYSVPQYISVESTFPRTGSGKINRRALSEKLAGTGL